MTISLEKPRPSYTMFESNQYFLITDVVQVDIEKLTTDVVRYDTYSRVESFFSFFVHSSDMSFGIECTQMERMSLIQI